MCRQTVAVLAGLLCVIPGVCRGQTLFTTHFFDWYRVTEQQPYEAMQRVFTFRPDWEGVGLQPSEVGVTQRYYSVQFRMIQEAGFDGIHYEWFGAQPSEECLAALKETGLKVAMFYDQEIRFHGQPLFIKPTEEARARFVEDVVSFYERIPKELWLTHADGSLPLIFYGYQFDQSFQDADAWHRFYRGLLDDLKTRLGYAVHIYWTDSGALCQTYAFQHFPEISSYSFSWWGGQRQINPRSVTFVLHYDDEGAVAGGRAARTVAFDNRFIEEHLQLAQLTRPRLVFNYGWNEYFEGENIFPDTVWGRWRLETMAAIVRHLRNGPRKSLPPTVLLLDDLYRGHLKQPGSRDAEHNLVGAFRYLFPQAEARLGIQLSQLPANKPIVVALSRQRTDEDERALLRLAEAGQARVVFFEPDPERRGPLLRSFVAGTVTRPMANIPAPPDNQWVGAEIPVDVDAAQYPFLRIRVRNSAGTFYHVRVRAVDETGDVHENHDNNSPLDWKTTGGLWDDRHENMKAIVEAYAGRPVRRFVGLVVIINATSLPGDYTADFADAEFCDAAGNVGLRVPLGNSELIRYRASFINTGRPGFPEGRAQPTGPHALQLSLKARFAHEIPVDVTSRAFQPAEGVEVLSWGFWPPKRGGTAGGSSIRVPLVLRRGNLFFVNTLSAHADVYGPLMKALGMPPVRVAEHIQFQQVKGAVSVQRPRTVTILGRSPLPVDRVRYYHPPNLGQSVSYPWPATDLPLAAVRLRNNKSEPVPITVRVSPTGITPMGMADLRPGDVVDIDRVPVRFRAAGRTVSVRSTRVRDQGYELEVTGSGRVTVEPLSTSVAVTAAGRPVRGPLSLPARITVTVAMPKEK